MFRVLPDEHYDLLMEYLGDTEGNIMLCRESVYVEKLKEMGIENNDPECAFEDATRNASDQWMEMGDIPVGLDFAYKGRGMFWAMVAQQLALPMDQ